VLTAMLLHGLSATQAGAQLRGAVSSVGGAVGGVGAAVGGVSSGAGSTVGGVSSGVGSTVGGSGLGGTDLGGSDIGGSGGAGLGVTDLGGMPAPTLRIPLPGAATPSDGVGAAKGAQGKVSSTARAAPVNTTTNSLMGPVTNTVSRTANTVSRTVNTVSQTGDSVLAPVAAVPGQVGAAARQAQNADPRNSTSGVPPAGERRFVPREVVVGLASDLSPSALDELARRHGLTHLEAQPIALVGTTFHRWWFGDGRNVSDVIRALEADGVVRTAQPNYRFTLAQSPQSVGRGQVDFSAQYASGKLHLAEAHRFATGKGVVVAVIDSGIDTSHPEIAGAVAGRFDAIAPGGPSHPHGTGMAGAIIARSQVTGTAPGARILAIRAFTGEGDKSEATTVSILKGLDWAMSHGARVVNMSFAGPYDPDISRGIAAARQRGAVLVAAAGNAGPKSPPLYPAADKNVIAVTATNSVNQLLPEANRGRYVAVAAPGVDVLVPSPGRAYQMSTGTSVAAAEVSGIAALLIELRPGITADEIRKILQTTALDLGPKGIDEQFGAGLVDAERAAASLGAAEARVVTPPVGAMLFADRWPDMPLMGPSRQ
jgi:subtilisin family serine protease